MATGGRRRPRTHLSSSRARRMTHQPRPPLSSPSVRALSARLFIPPRRYAKKGKGSPYSITERRVPELIPFLGSQPASDVSHKPDGRLPLLSARPAVTPATLKRAATSFAAW